MPAVTSGPLTRRSVDAVRPFALGLSAMLSALALTAPAAQAATTPTRTYEMVSPVDKGGNDVMAGLQSTPSGDAVAYMSLGGFAGTTSNVLATYYAAHRTADGWSSEPLTAPNASPAPNLLDPVFVGGLSADMRTAYYNATSSTSLSPDDHNGSYDAFSVTDGIATWLTPSLTLPDTTSGQDSYFAAVSADDRHVVVQSSKQLTPSLAGGVPRVYERVGGALRVASVLPDGTTPAATFGGNHFPGSGYAEEDPRAISSDGSRIFFGSDGQLYVRIDATTTELLSGSQRTGDNGAAIAGAAAKFVSATTDGTRVIFTAAQPLTDDAPTANGSGGIYRYDTTTGTLELLAALPTLSAFQGVSKTAPDLSRTYFATTEALTADATAGPTNFYVAGTGGLRYVGRAGAGYDAFLNWSHGEGMNFSAVSPDGKRFAFTSTLAQAGAATSGAPQVYVYDADADGRVCVSCPPRGGAGSSTSADLRDVPGNQQAPARAFTDDGSLVFETQEALVPQDVNHDSDVYLWDGYGSRLISSGTGGPSHVVDNSADGRDVFFRTGNALVPQDVDGGYADIYDARIDGTSHPITVPCAGEACRGPQSPGPAGPVAPASLTVFDTSAPSAGADPGPTFKVAAISAAARARWASTGSLTLSVTVSDAAVLTAKATATIGKRKATVASASAGRASAGSSRMTLRLTSAARRALRRSGLLTIRLTVTCSDTTSTARTTIVLRTSTKKAGR